MVAEDDSALEGQSRSLTEPALEHARRARPAPTTAPDPGAADRLERARADRAPRARPLRAARLDADRADGVRRPRSCRRFANLAVTVVNGVHHRPGDARASTSARASTRSSCSATPTTSTAQAADARTLVTLLHVRDILAQARLGDPGGQRDARRPQPGARLGRRRRRHRGQRRDRVSLLVTQLSEDGGSRRSSRSCSAPTGSEIYLRPAEWYVQPGDEVSYATVVAGATPARRDGDRAASRRCWPTRG